MDKVSSQVGSASRFRALELGSCNMGGVAFCHPPLATTVERASLSDYGVGGWTTAVADSDCSTDPVV